MWPKSATRFGTKLPKRQKSATRCGKMSPKGFQRVSKGSKGFQRVLRGSKGFQGKVLPDVAKKRQRGSKVKCYQMWQKVAKGFPKVVQGRPTLGLYAMASQFQKKRAPFKKIDVDRGFVDFVEQRANCQPPQSDRVGGLVGQVVELG